MTLRIAPVAAEVGRVREALVAVAHRHAMPAEEIVDFVTAVCEAVANAIEHGRSSEAIEVTCVREGDALVASVVDHGLGFDVNKAKTHLAPSLAERGRGIPIMRRCSDIFSVHSVPGFGTTVVIGRYLDSNHHTHPASHRKSA